MSTSPNAAINPKGPRVYLPGTTPGAWVTTYFGSSVGHKVLTALTGLGLAGFVVFHMIGNLKMLPGGPASREAINAYAHFLKHDLGLLLWIARGGLLAIFVLHIAMAVRLHAKTANARPVPYHHHRTAQASLASRTMLATGVVIGAFVLFHLAHYTFAWVHPVQAPDGTWTNYLALTDEQGRHDVYAMMVAGFSTPWIAVLYLVAQAVLAVHLSHGVKSSLQTLGLVGRRFSLAARWLGYAVALSVLVGNGAIVLAVWLGYVR
ncbi:MAG TPA: succinate dehydrogenase cytochrome b subunit [Fimbriiglobus sp.]|nr:succinate dehydrogenase cytochrome b subunit [Fimbriiglobus sp.]